MDGARNQPHAGNHNLTGKMVRSGLLPLLAVHILVVLLVFLVPAGGFRFFLGAPAVLFSPGYILLLALFPRRDRISWTARTTLSVALSIVVFFAAVFPFQYTPWGITAPTALASLSTLLAIEALAAVLRFNRLPASEVVSVFPAPALRKVFAGPGRYSSAFLALAMVAALGTLAFSVAFPTRGEHYTEFYLLDANGKADLALRTVTAGQPWQVTAGIANQEGRATDYTVVVIQPKDGRELARVGPIRSENGNSVEQKLAMVLTEPGENQQVEFILFREGDPEPYRTVGLWVNVRNEQDRFSEFYVSFLIRHPLQRVHRDLWYPATVGVENHEGREVTYRVEMWVVGPQGTEMIGRTGPFTVAQESRYDTELKYSTERRGGNTAIFLLFKDGEDVPYSSFRLPMRVS